MGKLIVLEGTDGSGKSTQFARLCRRMEEEGRPFERIIFPQYDKPSSALVKLYLNGEFGHRPEDVNPYAASAFYAVDRFASYVRFDFFRRILADMVGGYVERGEYDPKQAVELMKGICYGNIRAFLGLDAR